MRFFYIALLVLVAFVAIEADSTAANLKLATSKFASSLSDNPTDSTTRRLLRADKTEDDTEEERAISVPGLNNGVTKTTKSMAKVKTWVQTKVSLIKTWWAEMDQIGQWQIAKASPDDAFKALQLDAGTDTLLANPKLNTWFRYLRIYNKQHKAEQQNMLGVFTKFYGDEAVAKMLELGRRNPKTLKRADSLQGQQLTAWRSNGLSQDVVFQVLKLDKNLDTFFSNPNALVWYYYFFRGNADNPNSGVDLVKTLTRTYGDDAVVRAIEAAKKVEGPKDLPAKVKSSQDLAKIFDDALSKL